MSGCYGVRSLRVGECEVPGPELFWMSGWNEWYPLVFQVALIQGHGWSRWSTRVRDAT